MLEIFKSLLVEEEVEMDLPMAELQVVVVDKEEEEFFL
jgi:hypothetical protein